VTRDRIVLLVATLGLVATDAVLGASYHVPAGTFAVLGVAGGAALVGAAKLLAPMVQRRELPAPPDRTEPPDGAERPGPSERGESPEHAHRAPEGPERPGPPGHARRPEGGAAS
jgi:hypothetical protein